MTAGTCFIIAEAGVNHNGELSTALELVDAAVAAGADAVKFQTFRAELLVTAAAPKADYQIRQTGEGQSQSNMLKALELGEPAYREIATHCGRAGIEFMSTPFDEPSVAVLVGLGVRRLKVSSGDVTNGPLLLCMARTGLPIILSTGMATLDEIRTALAAIAFGYLGQGTPGLQAFDEALRSADGQEALRRRVTVLHCTSDYPAQIADVNLRAMDTIAAAFGLATGYSDHTVGITVPIAAAARGAVAIEKHLTLDRSLPGPDHAASLEPADFAAMVRAIRDVDASLGSPEKQPSAAERRTALVARRSLHVVKPIRTGETFTATHLAPLRPGIGRSPMALWSLIGTAATRDYEVGEAIE
jgi:N-acetylneuraminate synthase